MSHFLQVYRAYRLQKKLEKYKREKEISFVEDRKKSANYKFWEKIRNVWSSVRKRVIYYVKCRCWVTEGEDPLENWFTRVWIEDTFENYIAKSGLGFMGGIFFTYLTFGFLVFQLNLALATATVICSIIGIILTLGLAFSCTIRSIVFLVLPQIFSKRGRQALIAYTFILTLTGPGKNIVRNTRVISESLACGQEQLKNAARQIINLMKQPFVALRKAMQKVMNSIKTVLNKMKTAMLGVKRIVVNILSVFKTAFEWLGSVVNVCNKKLGTPFERCMRVMEDGVEDCRATLGPTFSWLCNLTYVGHALCYIVKPLDLICMVADFIKDTVLVSVKKKLRQFGRLMYNAFYVKVKFKHSFNFETTQSKSWSEVASGIVTEIRDRADEFVSVFDWMCGCVTFFAVFIVCKTVVYRHKFLTKDPFDNHYITKDFLQIDLKRTQMDKETVLPLNRRERAHYIMATSCRLVKEEKLKLVKSAVFLAMQTFKVCIHMVADYSLYWILDTIRRHGEVKTEVQGADVVKVHVDGEGPVADMYGSVIKSFEPLGTNSEMDTTPCLPDPSPPDLGRYMQILSLLLLCWFLSLTEPYGLRLRQRVMSFYHPDRAKQRAVWLYNHIIRSRGTFLKFARRQLRRKFVKGGAPIEKVSLLDRLRAQFPILRRILGKGTKKFCLVCGEAAEENSLIACQKPNCVGMYCSSCYRDIRNLCTICMEPVDYGDVSDVSEEVDSSDVDLKKMSCSLDIRKRKSVRRLRQEKRRSVIVESLKRDREKRSSTKSEEESGSSKLSFSYQFDPNHNSYSPDPNAPIYRDVEKQRVPDEVSADVFRKSGEVPTQTNINDNEDDQMKYTCTGLLRYLFNRRKQEGSKEEETANTNKQPSLSSDHSSSRNGGNNKIVQWVQMSENRPDLSCPISSFEKKSVLPKVEAPTICAAGDIGVDSRKLKCEKDDCDSSSVKQKTIKPKSNQVTSFTKRLGAFVSNMINVGSFRKKQQREETPLLGKQVPGSTDSELSTESSPRTMVKKAASQKYMKPVAEALRQSKSVGLEGKKYPLLSEVVRRRRGKMSPTVRTERRETSSDSKTSEREDLTMEAVKNLTESDAFNLVYGSQLSADKVLEETSSRKQVISRKNIYEDVTSGESEFSNERSENVPPVPRRDTEQSKTISQAPFRRAIFPHLRLNRSTAASTVNKSYFDGSMRAETEKGKSKQIPDKSRTSFRYSAVKKSERLLVPRSREDMPGLVNRCHQSTENKISEGDDSSTKKLNGSNAADRLLLSNISSESTSSSEDSQLSTLKEIYGARIKESAQVGISHTTVKGQYSASRKNIIKLRYSSSSSSTERAILSESVESEDTSYSHEQDSTQELLPSSSVVPDIIPKPDPKRQQSKSWYRRLLGILREQDSSSPNTKPCRQCEHRVTVTKANMRTRAVRRDAADRIGNSQRCSSEQARSDRSDGTPQDCINIYGNVCCVPESESTSTIAYNSICKQNIERMKNSQEEEDSTDVSISNEESKLLHTGCATNSRRRLYTSLNKHASSYTSDSSDDEVRDPEERPSVSILRNQPLDEIHQLPAGRRPIFAFQQHDAYPSLISELQTKFGQRENRNSGNCNTEEKNGNCTSLNIHKKGTHVSHSSGTDNSPLFTHVGQFSMSQLPSFPLQHRTSSMYNIRRRTQSVKIRDEFGGISQFGRRSLHDSDEEHK